jgi:pyruvate dehydrogenase E1 component alpha subunit
MSAFLEEKVLGVHHWTDRLFSFTTSRDPALRFSNGHFTMIGLKVDGNDVAAVDAAATQLVAEIRAGGGPRLLHAVTYRFKGHVSVDPGTYRDPAEVEAAKRNDPLLVTQAQLRALGATLADISAIDAAAQAEIDHALQVAEAAPWPEVADAYEEIMNSGAGVWK